MINQTIQRFDLLLNDDKSPLISNFMNLMQDG